MALRNSQAVFCLLKGRKVNLCLLYELQFTCPVLSHSFTWQPQTRPLARFHKAGHWLIEKAETRGAEVSEMPRTPCLGEAMRTHTKNSCWRMFKTCHLSPRVGEQVAKAIYTITKAGLNKQQLGVGHGAMID